MYSLRLAEINHGSGPGLGGAIQQVDTIIERFRAGTWLIGGLSVALAAGVSVVPLAGTAEIVAAIAAGIAGVTGIGAAAWRRRLDTLPLELAPVLARWEGPTGTQLTARAWLGRGRRLDRVRFEVTTDRGPVQVLAFDGPVIGPFQAVFEQVDAPVTVRVRGEAGGHPVHAERRFLPEEQVAGRFHAAFSCRKGRWRWRRDRWPGVRERQ